MKRKQRYHPDFLEIASARVEASTTTTTVSIGALAALFAFATLDPVTGFAIAAYTLYKAWKDEGEAGDAEEYFQSNPAPAPFLSKQELSLYARHFGKEKALDEIEEAIGNGIKVSTAARRFAKHHGLSVNPKRSQTNSERTELGKSSELAITDTNDTETNANDTETNPREVISSLAVEELIDAPAVAFIGEMGSGKTSKLAWLMGRHVERGDRVLMINPFCAFGEFGGIEVFGRGNDFSTATKGIQLFIDEAKRRIEKRALEDYDPLRDRHWHLALDEMTNYSSKLPDDLLAELWETTLQGLRQCNMSVGMVSHGFTQRMLGGSEALKGLSDAIERQFVVLLCKSKPNPNYRPSGGQSPKIPESWGILQRWDGAELKRDRVDCSQMQAPNNLDFRPLQQPPLPKLGRKSSDKLLGEPIPNFWRTLSNSNRTPNSSELPNEPPNPSSRGEFASSANFPELLTNLSELELRGVWEKVRSYERTFSRSAAIKKFLGKGSRYQEGKEAYEWLRERFG
jgi:hypothetical protein